jgi:hypothetical protein
MDSQAQEYEQILLRVVHTLPPAQVTQLVDFARFLEAQVLTKELARSEDEEIAAAGEARWDALLTTEEGQALLEKLADEALAEHHAGNSKSIVLTEDGRLAPG